MDKPLSTDDKFLASMKKKHETKQKDKVKVETQTMKGILGDIVQVPDKLHMTGSPDKPSAKPKKEGENPLHTGEGEDMFKSTMNKEG